AGITEVSGGDYLRSNAPVGYWALTSNSIFVGETQPGKPYTRASGTAQDDKGCRIASAPSDGSCVSKASSTAIPFFTAAHMISQRFYNIYDGPAYQDANAYLDIKVSSCPNLTRPRAWLSISWASAEQSLPTLRCRRMEATCQTQRSAGSSRTASTIHQPS